MVGIRDLGRDSQITEVGSQGISQDGRDCGKVPHIVPWSRAGGHNLQLEAGYVTRWLEF